MKRLGRNLLLFILVFVMLPYHRVAQAQGTVTFGETIIENDFPNSLTFRVDVTSGAGEIVKAELVYAWLNQISSISWTREQVDIKGGAAAMLEYVWETEEVTTPPSLAIVFYWRVTDSAGNVVKSEQEVYRYDDIRFDWEIRENDAIAVWWHDKPDDFGDRVFEIARRAMSEQRELFQVDLDYQIRIIIYNNSEEFDEWHSNPVDWVGGEAFSNFGITTQIVRGSSIDVGWLNDVVPHEISHLYFAKVTYNPTTLVPHWLNEGVSQYNEFNSQAGSMSYVESVAVKNELIPLSSLSRGFGRYDVERVRLAYAESVTAVMYMVYEFGKDGVANLLAGYRNGLSTEEAFEAAFNQSMDEFEAGWAVWVGVPEGLYVTPTAWGLPTFPASPTAFVLGSTGSGEGDETPEPDNLQTETPEPVAEAASPTPVTAGEEIGGRSLFNCLPSVALLFAGLVFVREKQAQKKRKSPNHV